jgi:preprotein translocase subunit SecG
MNYFETLLLVVHLVIAGAVCGFVLLQHGKGADMGAAFGRGASGSLWLTFFGTVKGRPAGLMEQQGVMEKAAPATPSAPDVPKPAADVPQPSGAAPASSPPQPAQNTASPAAPASGASGAGGAEKKGEVPK